MSRYTTAPRGVATQDDLALRSLSVGGTPVIPAVGQNPDWFRGGNPYNLTSTPADAAKLAAILAQKLATYLIEYSVVAKNCLRVAVPSNKSVLANGNGAGIYFPTSVSTGVNGLAWVSQVDYPAGVPWSGGSVNTAFGAGTFTAGTTQTINPRFVLQSDALIDELARCMAIGYLDTQLLALYNQFTNNAPVGTPGSQVTAAVMTAAIAAIAGNAAYVAGSPIFFVLSETDAKGFDTVALEPDLGWVASDYISGRRRIYSGGVLAEIFTSERVKVTGTGPATNHNIAFTPLAIGLVSSAVQTAFTDPNSTTPFTTASIVSSTAVNNFVASVKYGLTAASGNNFAFNALPNCAACLIDNGCGIRVES